MAPETKSKKRKSGGAVTSPSTKKLRKSEAPSPEEQPAPVKTSKKSKKEAPKQDEDAAVTRSKSSRKRATDFFDAADEEADAAESTPKKSKKAKKEKDEKPVEESAPAAKPVKGKKAKKEKDEEPAEVPAAAAKAVKGKKRKAAEEPAPVEEPAEEEEIAVDGSEGESEDEDDQTKALLKGFESDEDEEDGEDEGDLSKLPALPDSKKLAKQLKKVKEDNSTGVIYIGRVPHGFYEHQMKAYFTQFGEVKRVRVARNKKTGRSKHYAFVEFANNDVAKIVAETMDKYLMFGHILQVRYIPAEQVHPELFKGSNKRFKAAPRNKMQGRHLRLGMVREDWDKRIEREEKRRKSKGDKLKEMGYDFEAPAIKSTNKIPKRTEAPAEAEEAPKTLTDKAHDEEDQEVAEAMEAVKKSKKSKKRESNGAVEEEKEKEPVKVKATKEKKDAGKAEKADKKASKPKAKKAKTSA
ncbi:ribosomal biogenesis protein gar2 [Diplodia corticola]|uniref:Ribosomal biogenesis protein gar2 n=1 Tax=Diplodia corticola TaxID=236234 RepID=A0A1J9QSS9_9PEZI|nr:ribosomal biogenesis protein gar2 [Diplodia corticola]OJD31042.1 ribosomal biogenesis protein gar2 [Diplodia corticola]